MTRLTEQQKAELKALEEMPEEEIDFSDIPEGPLDPSRIRRGVFYIPVKQQVTLTLDEYVLNWFEETEPDEKNRSAAINQILIEHIQDRKFSRRKIAKKAADQG